MAHDSAKSAYGEAARAWGRRLSVYIIGDAGGARYRAVQGRDGEGWQIAMRALLLVAEHDGPPMFARDRHDASAGTSRAESRHEVIAEARSALCHVKPAAHRSNRVLIGRVVTSWHFQSFRYCKGLV